jgi:hypothetical protein
MPRSSAVGRHSIQSLRSTSNCLRCSRRHGSKRVGRRALVGCVGRPTGSARRSLMGVGAVRRSRTAPIQQTSLARHDPGSYRERHVLDMMSTQCCWEARTRAKSSG